MLCVREREREKRTRVVKRLEEEISEVCVECEDVL